MAIPCTNIDELILLLKENGDKILDSSSKLTLSTTLLYNLNEMLRNVLKHKQIHTSRANSSFNVIEMNHCDVEFLYDFIQKTFALKLLPDSSFWNNERLLNIDVFSNLRLLEVQRLSFNLVQGIKNLRTQLEYLTCVHSLRNLNEVLETCGADDAEGFEWKELKRAIFSYNSLDSVDNSLEYVPQLHTLDLSHNRIQNARLLHCLPNLKYLNISYNQLDTVPFFAGQLCFQLQVLVLNDNFIEDLKELEVLVNLCQLDLSNNCLLEHSSLKPLTNLAFLTCLNLMGNPLSYHPKHRAETVCYLNANILTQEFKLDMFMLNKSEKRLVGVFCGKASLPRTRLSSECSLESEHTIIVKECKDNVNPGEIGSSTSSVATLMSQEEPAVVLTNCSWLENTLWTESIGMQDSGIVDGRRPTSPSESSIGSATSLTNNEQTEVRHCESDIEVLSNPSQSSIEVIRGGSVYRRCEDMAKYYNLQNTHECNMKAELNTFNRCLRRSL